MWSIVLGLALGWLGAELKDEYPFLGWTAQVVGGAVVARQFYLWWPSYAGWSLGFGPFSVRIQ
jgi:hypothetical protein